MASKNFSLNFDASMNISQIKGALSEIQRAFSNIKLPQNLTNNLETTFKKISDEISNFESLTSKSFNSLADVSKATNSFDKILNYYSQLEKYSKDITSIDKDKLFSSSAATNIKKANQALENYYSALKNIPAEIERANKALEKQENTLQTLTQKKDALAAENKSLGSTKGGISQRLSAQVKEQKNIATQLKTLEESGVKKTSIEYKDLASQYSVITQEIKKLKSEYTTLDTSIAKNKATMANLDSQISSTKANIAEITDEISKISQLKPDALDKLRVSLSEIKNQDISEIPTDIKEIENIIKGMSDAELNRIKEAFDEIKMSVEGADGPLQKTKNSLDGFSETASKAQKAADEVKNLKNQVMDFFSLSNSVQLFKRAIESAFDTVKELDATMTEAAVVTDFSISDMWNQLPTYSNEATKLGATINDLYGATTLYYQQGLNTNQAMGVGIETMKMARIASMESTEATQLMTAALRGFNMEINETSAQRINDVYSELAAITAADTAQIGTAMSKTASIAASANMEFETTAAFLSQIIETTQEAPETAGTALKTIIARFTEVKELFSEGQLLGTDSEGEKIDINKIDTALKNVGISLKDFLLGEKGLDDILLELASKWDSLDIATQRYIATTAAGSRQQSRFLAMMSNYDRTMELVDAANNSAGASQEQFNKTLDSLDSKLNQLANAWNEYTMGLANNEVIKIGIDLLTDFLSVINNVTDALPGPISSFSKLLTAIIGLKAGKAVLNSIFSFIGKSFLQTGEEAGQNLTKGIEKSFTKASLKTRSWAKTLNADLTASFNRGNLDFTGIARSFSKVPQEIRQEIHSSFPQIGQNLINDFKSGINYDNLTDEGKAKAQEVIKGFEEGLKAGNTTTAINTLAFQATGKDFDWSKAGGKNETNLKASANTVKTLTQSMTDLGNATGTVGSIFLDFSDILRALGLEGAANIIDKIGMTFTSLGGIVSSVGAIMTAAGVSVSSAWIPVIAVFAALAAVVGLGVWAAYTTEQQSLTHQLEEAQKATERAKETAEQAKTSYDNLLSEKENYNNLQSTLDELIEGTVEFKQALIEANQQVLNLISTYPELAKYISRGEYGELTISDEGWSSVIEQQEQAVENTSSAALVSQLNEGIIEREKAREDLQKKYDIAMGQSSVDLQQLLDAYSKNPEIFIRTRIEAEDIDGLEKEVKDKLKVAYNAVNDEELKTLADSGPMYLYSDALLEISNQSANAADALYSMKDSVLQYTSSVAEIDAQNQALARSLVESNLSEEILSSEGVDLITDTLSNITSVNLSDVIDEKAEEIKQSNDSIEDLQKEYNSLPGLSVDELSDEIKEDKDALAKEIAKIEIGQEYQQGYEEFFSKVKKAGEEGQGAFSFLFDVLSKDEGAFLEEEDISKLTELNPSLALKDIAEQLGYIGESGLSDMAKDLGLSVEGLVSSFSESIDVIDKRNKKNKEDIFSSMMSTGAYENSQDMLTAMAKMSIEQRSFLNESLEKVSPLGKDAQSVLLKTIPDISLDVEAYKEAQDLIDGINFNNPIASAEALQKATSSSNEDIKILAGALEIVSKDAFSTGEQFKYLLQSADFSETNAQLNEFLKENGKISASNIEEVAASNSDLNKMLSLGEVSAAGLARVLTELNLGNIDPSGLTGRVLKAISSVTTLDDALSEMHLTIENFDPGIDTGEGIDFLSDAYDTMLEYFNNGELGNQQFQNFFKQIFGQKTLEEVLAKENPVQAFENYINKLGNWTENDSYGFWSSFANKDHTLPESEFATRVDSNGDILLGYVNSTGEFIDDVQLTSDELRKTVAEEMGITEETANMLIQGYSSHSMDLVKELEENNFKAQLEELLKPENMTGDFGVISQSEIEDFATLTGKTTNELINYINENYKGKIKVVDWFDESGAELMGEDLINSIKSQLGVEGEGTNLLKKLDIEVNADKVDIDVLKEKLSNLGLSEDQITSAIDTIAEESDLTLTAEVEIPEVDEETGTVEMTAEIASGDSVEALTNDIESKIKSADYSLFASNLANQDFSQVSNNLSGTMNSASQSAASNLRTTINGVTFSPKTVSITPKLTTNTLYVGLKTNGVSTGGSTKVADSHSATGTGPKGFYKTGTSLVGEEGRELVQTKTGAYLVGIGGPEIVPLSKGDIVYSNKETEQILKSQPHNEIKRYSRGTWGPIGGSSGNSSSNSGSSSSSKKPSSSKSSSSSKKSEKWENTFDWLYNLTQDINEELREREKLEKKYNRLLEDRNKSATDILKNIKDQEASLKQQQELQQEMYDKRQQEMKDVLSEYKKLSKYATYNWEDKTIEINWDLIDKVTNKDTGEKIEEYISRLEEIEESMDDAEDSLDDIIDELEELQKVGEDEYQDLEDRVLDALVTREQEKIDELSRIDESITDANDSLLNSIQTALDKIRQDRQNQETEQEISDQERRLAYLQQDTSGANDLEIKQLQEDIANQKQDYTDTLIDQNLTAIQEQNEMASEERQRQIELAQAQLEEMQRNGDFWNEAYALIKEGTDATGKLVADSTLTNLLKNGEAWESMSHIQKMEWLGDLENTVKAAMVYFSSQRQLEKIGKTSGTITFTNAEGEKVTGTVQKDGSVKVKTDKGTYTYKEVFQNFDGTYQTLETDPSFVADPVPKPKPPHSGSSGTIKVGGLINAGKAKIYDYAGDKSGEGQYFGRDPIYRVLRERNGWLQVRYHKLSSGITGWFKKSDVKAYANGGLADFTGPAWLDGTKSKPEMVLNAKDTQNFIQLKDILSSLFKNNISSGKNGDNYFDIHIEVDSLGSDYDVEQLANKIKRIINNDARYRNVNSINLLR